MGVPIYTQNPGFFEIGRVPPLGHPSVRSALQFGYLILIFTTTEFGLAKEAWFTALLGLEHGIPSHDTFGEVYAAIDTDQFSDCFSRWVADLANLTEGEVIAIDGKCLRRSVDRASKKAAIHMVSA